MIDFRIEKLANNLLTYSVNIQKGDNILIEVLGEDGIDLVKELIKKAEELGAKPYFNIINYELLRIMLQNADEEQIKLYTKHDYQRMKDMDAYIGIRATSNTSELNGIPKENMDLYNKYYQKQVHFEERVKHTKWCILRYPNYSMAQMSKMNKDEFTRYVSVELEHGKNVELEYRLGEVLYKIKFLAADTSKGINIPSIFAIPLSDNINNQLVVESNNLESGNLQKIIEQGIQTGIGLAKLTNDLPGPIVIPLIPSHKDYPYLQQISKECFNLSVDDRNYRIDEQVVKIINYAKFLLAREKGLVAKKRIFLNGYSSSGVFAQRFALLHPNIVETVCIGGASGSIPIPTEQIAYPLGIADYESLTGKKFDLDSYLKIKFRYYVGEFELQNKTDSRFDDFGKPAPMHDMSYFDRSVPIDVGKSQRNILGTEMFYRAKKTVQLLQNLGIDVQHKIISGRGHDNKNGVGFNELGDKYISDTYKSTVEGQKIDCKMSK